MLERYLEMCLGVGEASERIIICFPTDNRKGDAQIYGHPHFFYVAIIILLFVFEQPVSQLKRQLRVKTAFAQCLVESVKFFAV